MKSHPILFSAPMIRALLAGTKSQTRRIVTRTNSLVNGSACNAASWASLDFQSDRVFVDGGPSPTGNPGPYLHVPRQGDETVHRIYPRWQPDDLLWVKEAWRVGKGYDEVGGEPHHDVVTGRYRHARFMPRWASRITLKITDVRVQRLGEISEGNAMAEGYPGFRECGLDPHGWYRKLWNAINGEGSYASNPWVWAITFERIP